MTKEILNQIEDLFFKCLMDKTNWGRNDVKKLYLECQLEVLKDNIKEEAE